MCTHQDISMLMSSNRVFGFLCNKCEFSSDCVPAHQQLPRSPCSMSEGRGVRKTVHFTARSLELQQLISWGRSHFLTRCCTLSSTGKPTDSGPGGKLSSTKITVFWKRVRQNTVLFMFKPQSDPGSDFCQPREWLGYLRQIKSDSLSPSSDKLWTDTSLYFPGQMF